MFYVKNDGVSAIDASVPTKLTDIPVIPNAPRKDRARLTSQVRLGLTTLYLLHPSIVGSYANRTGWWFAATDPASGNLVLISTKPNKSRDTGRAAALANYGTPAKEFKAKPKVKRIRRKADGPLTEIDFPGAEAPVQNELNVAV